jgi:hypothetical protein
MYELNLSHTSPPRLKRRVTHPQTYLSISKSTCPSPETNTYAATFAVPRDIFEDLVHTWHDAISSPASFGRASSGVSDAIVLGRLRDAILQGKSNRLAVEHIETRRHIGPWKRYEIFVADQIVATDSML